MQFGRNTNSPPSMGSPGKDGVYFTVTAMAVDDNRTLKAAIKDKDGYYKNVPVAVLGTVTRNKTRYSTKSFIEQLTGETTLNCRLNEATLFSEYGHPFVNTKTDAGIERLLHLEPKEKCCHIRSISVKRVEDLGLDLVIMDAKPDGPYGSFFDNSMQDPTMNVAFSLRGISRAKYDKITGITDREFVSLVTFDSDVASGGFKQAAKRYIDVATESLSQNNTLIHESNEILVKPISEDDFVLMRSIAVEAFTNSEINEIMKATRVIIGTSEIGFVDKRTKTVVDQITGGHRSLFHTFSKVRK